jgi:hypothetical protein
VVNIYLAPSFLFSLSIPGGISYGQFFVDFQWQKMPAIGQMVSKFDFLTKNENQLHGKRNNLFVPIFIPEVESSGIFGMIVL